MAAIRVLHVLAQMNRGGVETWLMQVLRNVNHHRVRMDFLVTRGERGEYDDEITALGSSVIPCSLSNPVRFARRFLAILRQLGPFDVVHSHVHHFSGFVLGLAQRAGVPGRIAHSHSDTRQLEQAASAWRWLYLNVMEAAVRRYATHGLAASGGAAAALFGPLWQDDQRWRIARCGIEFGAFRAPLGTGTIRSELGIPPDALVLGHVGRFDLSKNQRFLVQIAHAGWTLNPSVYLVLVGDGPLRGSVEKEAARLGVRDRILFAGIRSDIPRILRSFDVFVFPSVREGLPLAGLEAQAAGLPIVISDRVTREIVVLPELFTWRSPDDGPESWAAAALSAARQPAPAVDPVAALEQSEFALARSLPQLLELYEKAARLRVGR